MVNNSDAQGHVQALLELRKENYPEEQSRNSDRNLDWGSCDKVPGRWEFVGDDSAYGDDVGRNFGNLGGCQKSAQDLLILELWIYDSDMSIVTLLA